MPSKSTVNNIASLKNDTLKKAQDKPKQGRPTKPESEKATKQITIKFTEIELNQIKEKAGLVPLATFIRNEIFNNTNIFK